MEKLIKYMCGDLENLNSNMRIVAKTLRTQNRINWLLLGICVTTGIVAVSANERVTKLEEKIESLTKNVEESEEVKGE